VEVNAERWQFGDFLTNKRSQPNALIGNVKSTS
jgi:hypothetical protein